VAIHTGGLPGTPNAARGVDAIAEECAAEAQMYAAAGFHGVVIENTHDRPYLKGSVGPEIAAALAVIGYQALASSSAIAERSIAVFNSGIVVWSTQSRSDATSSIS
jgi:predicted TIM-barrel enzyme